MQFILFFASLKEITNIKKERNHPKHSTYSSVASNERNKKRATHRAALKFYVTKVSSLKIKED